MLKQKAIETAVRPFIIDNTALEIPWSPLTKPLKDSRIALVTTAGVHLTSQEPFDIDSKQGDASFRELPASTTQDDYQITHTHYDHSQADKDINCVFPITRLTELVASERIGGLASTNYGFMGFITKPLFDTLMDNAKQIAHMLLEQEVDVVVLTPG